MSTSTSASPGFSTDIVAGADARARDTDGLMDRIAPKPGKVPGPNFIPTQERRENER